MGTDRFEDTISLWSDDNRKVVTLKNIQTGKVYTFVVKHSFVIGRNKDVCDLQITTDDLYISGSHMRFINDRDGLYVEDIHSKNGTRLNGRQVLSKTKIRQGDVLRIGRSQFEISL